MTRTSDRWKQRPGSFDTVNAIDLFASDNHWGIPHMQRTPTSIIPAWLAPYRTQIRAKDGIADGAIHFFLDDYRFETVWNRPKKALVSLSQFSTVLTPDFSLHADWPHALQIWNTYRSRWCGTYWQQQGFNVIPTVSWSGTTSYSFCFCGIPIHSVVAVSTVGVRMSDTLAYGLFVTGFKTMLHHLQPTVVLCYGVIPPICQQLTKVICYPTRWMGIRAERKQRRIESKK